MDIAGAHVVITGGSQGIGLETAKLMATRGARVSLIARSADRLEAAAVEVGHVGEPARWRGADVTDPVALGSAVTDLVATNGPCDLLVTCAGVAHPGYFEALDPDVFRTQMDLIYFGTLHAIRSVLPSMLERGRGGIVGVSSGAGLVGVFGYGAYAPAKYAVRGLMETLNAEYGQRGIYVGCVFPPDTLTPGFEAENLLKPPETTAASAGIAPKSAEAVAAAMVKGIEKGRRIITSEFQTTALAKGGALAATIAERQMAAQVRKVTPRF